MQVIQKLYLCATSHHIRKQYRTNLGLNAMPAFCFPYLWLQNAGFFVNAEKVEWGAGFQFARFLSKTTPLSLGKTIFVL